MNRPSKSIYTRASKFELENDWNNAFKLYLQAADAFLHISRTADPKYRNNAAKALDRARKIQQHKNLNPLSIDHFSHQLSILEKSSIINDNHIPLVTSSPSDSYTSPFNDPDGQPSLGSVSPSSTWKRPNRASSSLPLLPFDIIQNIVNDCSVCASIAVCIQHNLRFKSNLLLSSLSYFNDGRYELKVLVNVIDDRLPFDSDNKLVGISTGAKNQLWPSFVEKAYMKLMGGYDFPGSNSAVDLHVLTGWIPEHIDLQSGSFERERTWSRITTGFLPRYTPSIHFITMLTLAIGDCMMTVGTNDKTALNIHNIKLLPSHDYAVTEIKEMNDERWVTLLDSRICGSECECGGSGSCPSKGPRYTLDDICATFEGLYISWNPSLFGSHVTFHGSWQLENAEDLPRAATHHLRLNYQKTNDPAHRKAPSGPNTNEIDNKDGKETEIWVLLARHLRDTRRTNEYIALNVQEDDMALGDQEHVALKVPFLPFISYLWRSPTFNPSAGQFDQVGFTVTALAYSSDVVVSWDTRVPPAKYMQKIDGVLTHKTAGGNCTHPTYMVNPQYHLRVHNTTSASIDKRPSTSADKHSKTQVILTAQSTRDMSLNVTAVWSQGERISELSQKEVVAHSGLIPGDYTIILSAYEPDQTGKYTLKVESPSRFEMKSIPQEAQECMSKPCVGNGTRTQSNRYHRNPMYEVTIPCASEFGRINQPLSLFPSSTNLQRYIASSGPYSDALSGVDIPKRSIAPGKYYLVPSTYHAGVHARFRIFVYSSVSGIEVVLRA
ncbi:hypothetical protein BD769DRAFT_1437574 [Suillus cothurnatus]|nr:hypothetical protein BD769DRAFT_1437574 [Suillus cothurnatus]